MLLLEKVLQEGRKMVNLEQTSLCKQKVHGVAAVQFGTYCTEASIMNVMEFHSE